ncbi:flagellar FliJ family protein [Nocardioides bruguierae]|uniref:flagellar FliJ family protein n=1 Tax=Nocardioides bruguierae TaxID=2945102 RepID=UPI00202237A7|nr:flagellar FliJ family protein [Nocardioides bruguierae]MCL8027696.1 flagellar FliJ family protein [Nocardioides bruguierae]
MSRPTDPGLAAVARVRAVRERDSRLGLVKALAEVREREAEVARLEQSLQVHGRQLDGDMGRFVVLCQSLAVLREAASDARRRAESAALVATDAQSYWTSDKARLGAVEGLMERRADERRAEAVRAADAVTDEVASVGWLRRSRAAHHAQDGGRPADQVGA